MRIADLDFDGDSDVVVINRIDLSFSVLFNRGDATFGAEAGALAAERHKAVSSARFTEDAGEAMGQDSAVEEATQLPASQTGVCRDQEGHAHKQAGDPPTEDARFKI